jgi:hypothetical protein
MDFRKTPFDFNAAIPMVEAAARIAVERLGGELLAGSGFEDEKPDPDFQFAWALPINQPEGGFNDPTDDRKK